MTTAARKSARFASVFAAAMLCFGLVMRFVEPLSDSIVFKCFAGLTVPAYLLAGIVSGNVHGGPEAPYWFFVALEWFAIGFLSHRVLQARNTEGP
jgi:hypothetical protein